MAAAKLDARKLELSASTNTVVFGLMGIGLITFLVGLFLNAPRVWNSFLINHMAFMGLGIGAMFYLVVHYLAFAGWNVAVRRVTESFASYLVVAAVFQIVLFFGLGKIYPWTNEALMHSDHLLHKKAGFFNLTFFIVRSIVFMGGITFFMRKIVGNSIAQDVEGGEARLMKQKPLSAMYLVFFAPLFTVFAVDMLKSLDPKWFSTMYGVYVFIGFVQATAAATIIVIHLMKKNGYLSSVTPDHLHDCSKYMFGFTIFWAYIAVSQYLLIWYANLPEETTFYMLRGSGSWKYISLGIPLLRFFIPFLCLLPRKSKRTESFTVKIACVVLVGAWFDLYWLVIPYFSPSGVSLTAWDLGMFLGFLGVFAFTVRRFLSTHNTVPVKDPFLHETLHHHVM
jgi:hypothetical protein